jgi:hypothetical protein
MRRCFLAFSFLSLFFSTYLFSIVFSVAQSDVNATILPGTFYLSVFGDLQDGINLSGLGVPGPDPQVGYWIAQDGIDFINFFDSTATEGFRMQFSLGGDFIYSGANLAQGNIPASNFVTYAEWDSENNMAVTPTIAMDDLTQTLSIDSVNSCPLVNTSHYEFYPKFYSGNFAVSLSTTPFNYIVSSAPCVSQGTLNLGKFEFYMGFPSPGEYKSSMFIVMIDG